MKRLTPVIIIPVLLFISPALSRADNGSEVPSISGGSAATDADRQGGKRTGKELTRPVAEDIAKAAGGAFVEGGKAPTLSGSQAALPLIDKSTGSTTGHIIAETDRLVRALNNAGYDGTAAELKTAKTAADTKDAGIPEYYVQVGSWKNPAFAEEVMGKIKRYYPRAYMAVQGRFNKIRIPGISTMEQGMAVSRDIEDITNLKPIVVLKTE